MHVPINIKSPNNISEWQMGFNSAFKGLKHYIATAKIFLACVCGECVSRLPHLWCASKSCWPLLLNTLVWSVVVCKSTAGLVLDEACHTLTVSVAGME